MREIKKDTCKDKEKEREIKRERWKEMKSIGAQWY